MLYCSELISCDKLIKESQTIIKKFNQPLPKQVVIKARDIKNVFCKICRFQRRHKSIDCYFKTILCAESYFLFSNWKRVCLFSCEAYKSRITQYLNNTKSQLYWKYNEKHFFWRLYYRNIYRFFRYKSKPFHGPRSLILRVSHFVRSQMHAFNILHNFCSMYLENISS